MPPRTREACCHCRRRKVRCSGSSPCRRCSKLGLNCERLPVKSIRLSTSSSSRSNSKEDPKLHMTWGCGDLELSPHNFGPESHISSRYSASWLQECSVPDNPAIRQENWSLHDQLQDIFRPRDNIEQLITVFFRRISPVFCVVDQYNFEQEWQMFKYNCASFTLSWNALLLMILSFAHQADKEYSRVHDGISVGFELLAWKCLSQDYFKAIYSLSGLKAPLLLSYSHAHRGYSISALAKIVKRIAHKVCFSHPKEKCDVSNGIATLLSLNFHLSKRPGIDVVKFQIENSGTFSMIHAELDEISHKISQYVHLTFPHRVDQLVGVLESNLSYVLVQKQRLEHIDGKYVNYAILEGRLYYLVHYLFNPECVLTDSLGKDKSINAARKSLLIFHKLVLEENQPMWWYLKGLGSYYAASCAFTLAKYSDEDKKLLDQTVEIFNAIASDSAFCMQYLYEIEEARLYRSLFLH